MATPAELILEVEALQARALTLRQRWACDDPLCDGLPHKGWTHNHARGSQHEPPEYTTWGLVTGRGFGKTRTGAETVRGWGERAKRHIAVIAKSDREVRNICFEGPAGLMSVIPRRLIKSYNSASGNTRLTMTSGTVFRAFSAESPDNLRGYAFDGAWCDEFGAWKTATAQETLDLLWFCLRESSDPKVILTTTPRPRPHVKALLKAAEDPENGTVITRGHMTDNLPNLAKGAVDELVRRYEGTRIGRQELAGELLTDVEGALWTESMIDDHRYDSLDPSLIGRTIVAVDPATTNKGTSDETGIMVVCEMLERDHMGRTQFAVLEDLSGRYSPEGWSQVVSAAYTRWGADAVVAETNAGGDMVRLTLQQSQPDVTYRPVWASKGKRVRAEPVVGMYEQGRVHHVGEYVLLEEQLTTWEPDTGMRSPDRLDALVWAITDLAFRHTPGKVQTFRT